MMMKTITWLGLLLGLGLLCMSTVRAQQYRIERSDGRPPIYLPAGATLRGTYQRPIPLAGMTDPIYPNDVAVAHLLDPSTHTDRKVRVNSSGDFQFQGLRPGHTYYLAVADSFRYYRGYHGKRGWDADRALGAEPMSGHTEVSQMRTMFHAQATIVDARLSWHQIVNPPNRGSFALVLNRDNADARFVRALWPNNQQQVYRPARLISVGD